MVSTLYIQPSSLENNVDPKKALSDSEISSIKQKLKSGKLEKADLEALQSLVERTEHATKQLRAAIVE
jgi:hypothetical protein